MKESQIYKPYDIKIDLPIIKYQVLILAYCWDFFLTGLLFLFHISWRLGDYRFSIHRIEYITLHTILGDNIASSTFDSHEHVLKIIADIMKTMSNIFEIWNHKLSHTFIVTTLIWSTVVGTGKNLEDNYNCRAQYFLVATKLVRTAPSSQAEKRYSDRYKVYIW